MDNMCHQTICKAFAHEASRDPPRQKCSTMWNISTGLSRDPTSASSSIMRSMSTLAWMKSPSVDRRTVPKIKRRHLMWNFVTSKIPQNNNYLWYPLGNVLWSVEGRRLVPGGEPNLSLSWQSDSFWSNKYLRTWSRYNHFRYIQNFLQVFLPAAQRFYTAVGWHCSSCSSADDRLINFP